MATYTYEEIYSDPKKAIIRSSSDANIVGLRNGQEVAVVCDRKWGEFTPEQTALCFTNVNNGASTVTLNKVGYLSSVNYKYSTDGSNWEQYSIGSTITLSNNGDKVYFKGSHGSQSNQRYMQFVMSGLISASGNVNSMLSEDFENITDLTPYGSSALFYLFCKCTALTTPPKLPATTLANSCYAYMFDSCTSLIEAPELPATTLAIGCYQSMFYNCSFSKAPLLPAKQMVKYAYDHMFSNCGNLNEVRCYAENFLSVTANSLESWLYLVSSTGTFYKVRGVNWPAGFSGIPSGWTVVEMEAQS